MLRRVLTFAASRPVVALVALLVGVLVAGEVGSWVRAWALSRRPIAVELRRDWPVRVEPIPVQVLVVPERERKRIAKRFDVPDVAKHRQPVDGDDRLPPFDGQPLFAREVLAVGSLPAFPDGAELLVTVDPASGEVRADVRSLPPRLWAWQPGRFDVAVSVGVGEAGDFYRRAGIAWLPARLWRSRVGIEAGLENEAGSWGSFVGVTLRREFGR